MALYCVMCEGYTSEYRRLYGKPDRTTILKCGLEVRLDDIPDLFKDTYLASCIRFFNRWKTMGYPYGPWGLNPGVLVEVVDTLAPLDAYYHPKMM